VVLEHDAARPELGNRRLDVRDLEAHLRVISGGTAGGELAASEAVEQSARALVDRLETELMIGARGESHRDGRRDDNAAVTTSRPSP
jgi:hypothetical protein